MIAPMVPYITVGMGLLVCHNAWVAILSYHLVMLAVISTSGKRLSIFQIFKGGDKIRLPLLAAVGIGGGLLLWFLKPWVLLTGEMKVFTQSLGLTQQSWPLFITYFILVSPALEEIYWRSFLGDPSTKLVLNDFLFSGYHMIVLAGIVQVAWLVVIFLVLAAAAWIWRLANRLGGGLMSSFISHLTADISIILVSYLLVIR